MPHLPVLNLPPIAAPRLRQNVQGRAEIFDPLRGRFVTLTPEEWVRQHFTAFLIGERDFPAALIGNEVGVSVGGVARRCDTVVYARSGTPLLIVEYKAPHISITQSVFTQIQSYNSVLHVPYLIVTNGLTHYCCRVDYSDSKVHFLPEIPRYPALILPDTSS